MWTWSEGKDILHIRTIAEIHRCEPTFRKKVVEFTLKKKNKIPKVSHLLCGKINKICGGKKKKKNTSPEPVDFSTCHIGFFFLFLHLYIQISPCLKRAQWLEHLFYLLGHCTWLGTWVRGNFGKKKVWVLVVKLTLSILVASCCNYLLKYVSSRVILLLIEY
jgi:hypothetical protein